VVCLLVSIQGHQKADRRRCIYCSARNH
jgi:hypothetical protein